MAHRVACLAAMVASAGCELVPRAGPGAEPLAPPAEPAVLGESVTEEMGREASWIELGTPAAAGENCRAFLAGDELYLWSAAGCSPHRRSAHESWTPMSVAAGSDTWFAGPARERLVVYGYAGDEHRAMSYDPQTDTWSDTGFVALGKEPHDVVATSAGDTLLLWGGYAVDPLDPEHKVMPRFARYDPDDRNWYLMSIAGMPLPRYAHGSVFDSHHLFVFGGRDYSGALLGDGGVYDVGSDAWELVSSTNAPSPRLRAAIAWTGFFYVVFGGTTGEQSFLGDGGIYVPEPLWKWQPMSAPDAFVPRHPRAFWTGEHVVIVQTTDAPLAMAGYFPEQDAWRAIEPPPALDDFVVIDVHWDWAQHRAVLWGRDRRGGCTIWLYYPPYDKDPNKGHPGDNRAGNQTDP